MTSTQESVRLWIAVASAVASSATMSLSCVAPRVGRGIAWTAVAMVAPAAKPRAVRRLIEPLFELLSEYKYHLLVAQGSIKRSLLPLFIFVDQIAGLIYAVPEG